MKTSRVNRIINFSNVDGPHNRTAIFFQECNFNCLYCHNPETINKCIACGECVKNCPVGALSLNDGMVNWDEKKCVKCDTCLKVCKHRSSPKTTLMSVDDVMERIKKSRPYIKGITTSGGECSLQAPFLKELFKRCHELELTCFMDSNGSYDFAKDEELMSYTDAVMLDVKAYDKKFHAELCSYGNTLVIKNLHYLLDNDKMYEVRTVLLPGRKEDNFTTVSNVAKIIGDRCRYKLIRYRPFGVREEYQKILGDDEMSMEEANQYVELAKSLGCSQAFVL